MSRLQFKLKKTCFFVTATLFCIAITFYSRAHGFSTPEIYSRLTTDTIPGKDSLAITDSIIVRDTIVPRLDTFSIRISKDTLDAPVHYEAEDSAVLMVKEQKFYLYGKTKTTYKDIVLTAPSVVLDQQTNILTARGQTDPTGTYMITRAGFQQGTQSFQSDSMQFNFKTQRGLTANTFTQEGEMFIKAGTAKKINQNTLFIKEGYYTTCNYDDPHFAFKSNKLKIINEKLAVSGPTHPEFEGVPIPIYLPFGIYPLTQGRHSGFLPPQFTTNEQFGVGLEGIGYYHVLNDFYDVTVRGDFYSYGGWRLNFTPTYRKRYRYQGSFNLALQHTKFAFKGDPDYQLIKTFNVSWSHNLDAKAKPGINFSANVNAGSTKYNQYVPSNPIRNITNMLYSSVNFSRYWKDKPYSLQLSANHNQNNTTGLVTLSLPDASFTVNTIYPFARDPEKAIGAPKWYEKLGVGYNGSTRNQMSFYDTVKNVLRKALDTAQWGARHSFPISIQLPAIAGKFFLAPGVSYEETWLTRKQTFRFDTTTNRVERISEQKGFFIDRQMSFSMSMNTNVYGMFKFKNSTVRHVMRPSIGFSYRPNLSKKYYQKLQTDNSGKYFQQFPNLVSGIFSGYSYGRFGGLTFNLDNNLEMKKKQPTDSTQENRPKKLIDVFNISTSYNFLADSMRLTPLNMSLGTTLFEKVSLSGSAVFDPYQVGSTGYPINRFAWQDGFSLGRITNASISMSTSFQSKTKDGKKAQPSNGRTISDPSLLGDQIALSEYMNRNPAEFVDFNIPWSVNLSYSLNFINRYDIYKQEFDKELFSSVNFSNSFTLTPKWNFSTNGYYDFNTGQMTMFTMTIARDLHCWQMGINLTPIGRYKYFNITISPKASILQDLKVNRTRYFYNY